MMLYFVEIYWLMLYNLYKYLLRDGNFLKYAIMRYRGTEEEVEANAELQYHAHYTCPECGEVVNLIKSNYKSPHFRHHKRTTYTPECEKRVDGLIAVSLKERLGLSLYLVKNQSSDFKLYMAFPSLNEEELFKAQKNSASLSINNHNNIKISLINFQSNKTTLLPIDYIPLFDNYKIKYTNITDLNLLNSRWANFAEGFIRNGIIFSVENNGKKLKNGDSVVIGNEYYFISKSRIITDCPGVEVSSAGCLRLENNTSYQVFKLYINPQIVDSESQYFERISNLLYINFGTKLNEAPSDLVLLWPPHIKQEIYTPIYGTHKIFAQLKSPNNNPKVFYYTNGSNTPRVIECKSKEIDLPLYGNETIFSVDRKYVGREKTISKSSIDIVHNKYSVAILDKYLNLLNETLEFKKNFEISINSKIDLFVKSKKCNYKLLKLREPINKIELFSSGDELIFTANGYTLSTLHFEQYKNQSNNDIVINLNEINKIPQSVLIPVPYWIYKFIRILKTNDLFVEAYAIEKKIIKNQIPIGLVNYLYEVKGVLT